MCRARMSRLEISGRAAALDRSSHVAAPPKSSHNHCDFMILEIIQKVG
jgi:hypothetical protein